METRSSLGASSLRATNALFLLLVAGFVGVGAPLALHFLSPSNMRFDVGALRYAGAAAMLFGLCFYAMGMRAQVRAGETPSPHVTPRMLITHGVYNASRNPMYVAGAFYFAGLAGLLQSWPLVAYAFAVIFIYYPFLVRTEERALRATFGAEYEDYCRRTPRWIGSVESKGGQ